MEENRIHHGDLVMLVSFGSGYTWAGTLLRWLDSGSGNQVCLINPKSYNDVVRNFDRILAF
jgi:hypothetical protein